MIHDDWEPAMNKRISELEDKVNSLSKRIDSLYDMIKTVNHDLVQFMYNVQAKVDTLSSLTDNRDRIG